MLSQKYNFLCHDNEINKQFLKGKSKEPRLDGLPTSTQSRDNDKTKKTRHKINREREITKIPHT